MANFTLNVVHSSTGFEYTDNAAIRLETNILIHAQLHASFL